LIFAFWICAAVVAYVYAGYPALLVAGVFGRKLSTAPRTTVSRDALPLVSVIVAAHNEEAAIEAKILNVLESDYPRERIEILIGSDGSSDRTEEIVRRFEAEGVGLVSFPKQQGKSAIQNGLVALASGSILIFTDADCRFDSDAIRLIIDNFSESRIGLVTAFPRYANERETAVTQNESTYLRYESWIRAQESSRGLLAMASGSLFAIRREAWKPLDRNRGDDFELPLRTALAGKICVADPMIVATTRLSQNAAESMFRLKARIVSKDFRALMVYRAILNPARHGAVAPGLWSHKLLRWLVPCFLIALMASNLFLIHAPIYRATLAVQAAFYLLAAVGGITGGRRGGALLNVPFSFCLVNLAALAGAWRCLIGRTSGSWTPVRGESASA
jgi:cellulose synthase/poly-beta-1,6-N-acetylglucosamine synthase-like glycosyltransferase